MTTPSPFIKKSRSRIKSNKVYTFMHVISMVSNCNLNTHKTVCISHHRRISQHQKRIQNNSRYIIIHVCMG